MFDKWPHIPDEALHLVKDCQFEEVARKNGAKIRHTRTQRGAIVTASKNGRYVGWAMDPDGEPHPRSYAASIIRALVRMAIICILALAIGLILSACGVL